MKHWHLLALLYPAFAQAGEKIEFHYTNQQVLAASTTDQGNLARDWFDRCAAGGEFAELAASYGPDPRLTLGQREAAEKSFDRVRFEKIAQQAFDKVVSHMPQAQLTLCVDFTHPADTFARDQMRGVMALTAGSGKVIIKLHPEADWATLLPYVLAHELHHSYWAKHHFDATKSFTLGDYLVFEGRADYFAKHVFGQHPAPWIDALTDEQFAVTLEAFRPKFPDTSPEVLMGSMFGNPQAGIPLWAGYTVGYRLVAQRLAGQARPDWPAITAMPTTEFLPAAANAQAGD